MNKSQFLPSSSLWPGGETEHKQLITVNCSKCCYGDRTKCHRNPGVELGVVRSVPVPGEAGEGLRKKGKR